MITLETIPIVFNAVKRLIFNYFMFRLVFLLLCGAGLLHAILRIFFGVSLKFVNIFRMEVIGLGYKSKDVIVKIRSIRLVPSLVTMLSFTILIDGIEVTVRDNKDKRQKLNLNDKHNSKKNLKKVEELRESLLDINDQKLCLFPKNRFLKNIIKIYLLYLRFVNLKLLNVSITHEQSGLKLTTEISNNEVQLSTKDNITKFQLYIRAFQQGVNSVTLFQAFSIQISGILNMNCGDLSKVNISLDLIGANIPIYTLIQASTRLKLNKPAKVNVLEYTEHDYLMGVYKKLVFGSYFVKLIEKVNVSVHNLAITEIPLATQDLTLCQKYKPKSFIELTVSSVSLGTDRMHFDYPGYGLLYTYNDKPYHFTYNFTGISLSLNNQETKITKEVMNVPVMNFTGHSNLAFQNLEATKSDEFTEAKVDIIGHMSEPILDLSTDEIIITAMSVFDFVAYLHMIRSKPEYIGQQELRSAMKEKNKLISKKMDYKFQKFWPIFSFKMGIESPTLMIKDNFEEKYSRILVLQHSMVSAQVQSSREFNEDTVQYYTEQKIDMHHVRVNFRDTSTDLERSVFNIDNVKVRQRHDILPERNIQSSTVLTDPKVDLSNIIVLNGINYMFGQLDMRLSELFQNFSHHTEEFDCYCIKSCTNPYTEQINIQRENSLAGKSIVEVIKHKIPSWLHKLKFRTTNFQCVLGSRSLFLDKKIMKSLNPQSKRDFIDGKLRKVEFSSEEASFEFLDLSSAGADSEIIPSAVSSSIEEDDDIGLSDSTSDVSSEIVVWKLRLNFKKVVAKAITETTKCNDKLKDKIFLKIPKFTVDLRPSGNDEDKLLLDCDLDRFELMYSVITHFLIASSIHLLRNTIFEVLLKKLDASRKKKDKEQINTSVGEKEKIKYEKHPSFGKRILSAIEFGLNINFMDVIVVMPNKLKSRLEITNVNAFGLMNNPFILGSDFIRICVESPTTPGYWSRFATATDGTTTIDIPKIIEKGPGSWIDFTHNVCHITMPNKLLMYQVFNNISLLFKTVKQLHHSMKFNTNENILYPRAKHGTHLPRMNLKSNRLILSLEDDPFEAELNMILQIGLLEQRERMTKMRIFERELSDRLTSSRVKTAKSQTFSTTSSTKRDCKLPTPDFASLQQKIKTINHNFTDSFHEKNGRSHAQSLSNMPTKDEDPLNKHHQDAFEIQQDAQAKLHKLRENFSDSWIRRVKNFKEKSANELKESYDFLWGAAYHLEGLGNFDKNVLEFCNDPHLFTLILESVDLDIGPPSFGHEGIPNYIHDVGKGVPLETTYSTLFPMSLDLKLSELRLHLRDYPLPMIHMPAITKNQPKHLPAVRIHGDLIIGEGMIESKHEIREMFVRLSPGCSEFDEDNVYSIEIPKTVSPIKFYTTLTCDLNSETTTKVTWGNSFQPCIQQIMACLDNFTKPPIDPSPKPGFWDKIRANFHGRFRFNFNHNGDFHIIFKGSKNPYALSGVNSGFILGFQKNVVLTCNDKDDAKEFITANSEGIIFSVPNHFAEPLLVWCRPTHQSVFLTDPIANLHRSVHGYYLGNHELIDPFKVQSMKGSYIQKHVINLRGGTQMNFSMLFERKCPNNPSKRTTISSPHYDIVLSNPKYVKDLDNYDAYRGFRSDYIHLEFQLLSTNSGAYNTMQLTPLAFQYFFKWWKMFSNSLPVRQGRLFGPGRHSPKFSHYLFTLKYQALIEPFFMSHIHHDHEISVADHKAIECVGLKGKASRLVLDLHQRKELVFDHNETLNITRKSMKNKFNVGMIEILDFDVRAMKGVFKETSALHDLSNSSYDVQKIDFRTYDEDASWLDIADFVEISSGNLHDFKAKIQAQALMKTPRFIYVRKSPYGDKYQVDAETGESVEPFGHESYHKCLYDLSKSSVDTIVQSFNSRIVELESKVERNQAEIQSFGNKELLEVTDKHKLQQLKLDTTQIIQAVDFVKELSTAYTTQNPSETVKASDFDFAIDDSIEDTSFNNSFIVHNMLLKWNDSTRNIFYRYIFLIESLSTLGHFLLVKSLGQIDEAIEAQNYRKDHPGTSGLCLTKTITGASGTTAERTQTHFSRDTTESRASERLKHFKEELRELGVEFFYKTHDNYRIKLVSPQIQLQSDENKNSAIVVTAPNIEMNIISFDANENEEADQDIFEKRIGITFTDASIFMFHKNEIINTGKLFFSSTSYGSDSSWPPWLGVELCYDSHRIKDHVLLNKTTFVAMLDKVVNTSFLGTQTNQANKFQVDLSQAVFHCDSKQYFALYTIVLNLLIYNDTKIRSTKEREAKLLLKLDNKDISTIKDRILELQMAVKEARIILESMTSRRAILDDVEKSDLFLVNDSIFEALTELYLLMRVSLLGNVNTSNDKVENFMEWNIRADDIKLHMLDDSRYPFLDVVLFNSHFKRMERSDRSDRNHISIGSIEILNLDQESNLPVLFSALVLEEKTKKKNNQQNKKASKIIQESEAEQPLIHVSWQMENPVGGIRLMKRFEVDLLPLQISIEEATGKKLMEFAFPNDSPLFSPAESDDLEDGSRDSFDSDDDNQSQIFVDTLEQVVPNRRRAFSDMDKIGHTTGLTPIKEQAIEVSKLASVNGKTNGTFKASSLQNGKIGNLSDTSTHKRSFSFRSKSNNGKSNGNNDDSFSKNSNPPEIILTKFEAEENDEDIDLMLERASSYLSIVSFALRSSQISVTFRGTGAMRLINVSDFIIHLPEILLFNKTCTLLDLVNEIKKNVIKALLAHSGSLISNKLSKRDTQRHLRNISGYSSARIHTFSGDKFGKVISKYNRNYIEEYKKRGKDDELR